MSLNLSSDEATPSPSAPSPLSQSASKSAEPAGLAGAVKTWLPVAISTLTFLGTLVAAWNRALDSKVDRADFEKFDERVGRIERTVQDSHDTIIRLEERVKLNITTKTELRGSR